MDTRLHADLEAQLARLFVRCPSLCGFVVQDGDPVQFDLVCFPTPDGERAEMILGEISQMLEDLEEQRPGTAELLRGHTFARAFH